LWLGGAPILAPRPPPWFPSIGALQRDGAISKPPTREALRDFEFAELMNTFEIAAAIHQEKALQGFAKKLIENYLCAALKVIDEDEEALGRVSALRDTADTFSNLIRFRKAMKSKAQGITLLPTMQIAE
jgi:hypothetical protein